MSVLEAVCVEWKRNASQVLRDDYDWWVCRGPWAYQQMLRDEYDISGMLFNTRIVGWE